MSDQATCAFCGAIIPPKVMARRRRSAKYHFCNREHRQEWDRQNGFFKVMSAAGREARSVAVAKSNSEHPRRRKS